MPSFLRQFSTIHKAKRTKIQQTLPSGRRCFQFKDSDIDFPSTTIQQTRTMTEETTTSTTTATIKEDQNCSREELTELVRAIKFAKPDASQRAVHREISEELSKKDGFEFLVNVQLNDVKKIWKKALQQQQPPKEAPSDGVMKLYTVGDGTVRRLAQEYSQAAAAAAVAKEAEEMKNYVHLFLDVPADNSGSRPHQALINFHDNKNKNDNANNNKKGSIADERGEIVKIQMAAGSEEDQNPMLLYNQDRSQKTFIHPDTNDDDGYQRIQKWIREEGVGGALGVAGGTKAYFYSHYHKRKNIISVDVSSLAPPQAW